MISPNFDQHHVTGVAYIFKELLVKLIHFEQDMRVVLSGMCE